ncbi:RagB/SusD family nutrient uptake outer membrane protein [Parachryseolinea silvisoli]|uniref:RagB/SusD family nutrient uptake outer membrane protein n=1 Tax=Parachryseolinea silvisoli TaxID=2873601 RepID=UPI002265BE31|nr:RagB/SusD family nutrient uptake outer membrane protein [Parachryseolinea silvisoli]MCD9015537.1 RagB/SusD family nutrient uptake outer membrane protein [Parachryseolinea silvisoli]
MKKHTILFAVALSSMLQWGCEDMLEVEPFSELTPAVIQTDNGMKSLLFDAYKNVQLSTPSRWIINAAEVTTDVGFNTGGAENLMATQLINFTWDPSLATFQDDNWAPYYRTVRDVNLMLEQMETADITDANKTLYTAEARLLRAHAYAQLYYLFGSTPLRTTSTSPAQLARASDEEMRTFIEEELRAAIPGLPDPGAEAAYGRANKGQAWAILAKFFLNTKQWQKAADASQEVIGFHYYALFPEFENMFRVENEGDKNSDNKEMILVIPCLNIDGYGNWYTAGALPQNFKTTPQIPDYTWTNSMANFATQYRLRSGFVNTYDFDNDRRAILILRTYVNTSGATVDLMTTPDNARCMKYWDNATVGNHSGNDVPVIRYADILLTRAEALNELNGPTQEALNLINEVRGRAGLDDLTFAEATSKAVLSDLILRERGWEFVGEGKRREDLLRHDKFISLAQARGAAATDKHKLFPFPQSERDTNPISGQNPDYEVTQ